MQSIGEMPANLLQTLVTAHPRPSISAITSAESQEVDDSVVFSVTSSSAVDSSASKSPVNASSSEFFFLLSCKFNLSYNFFVKFNLICLFTIFFKIQSNLLFFSFK